MLYFSTNSPTSGGSPDAVWVIPIAIIFQCIGMTLSPFVQSKIGLSKTMLFGSYLMSVSVYLSSYSKNLQQFIVLYCVLFGTGIGMGYTSPLIAGWSWFPKNRGLISGIVLAGFGSGGFLFNILGTQFVNPNGLTQTAGLFPEEVYKNFPGMLRKLAGVYIAMQTVAALCLKSAPVSPASSVVNSQLSSSAASAPKQRGALSIAVNSKSFWLLWTCIVLSATAGLNTASIYKMYGTKFPVIANDKYLALVGGMGAIANGWGRMLWGAALDKLGFVKCFTILTSVQSITMLLYKYTVNNRSLFTGSTMLLFFCLGGNFAMAPTACAKIFGADAPKVFGVLFSAFAVAGIGGASLNRKLLAIYGYEPIFKIMAALSLTASVGVWGLGNI